MPQITRLRQTGTGQNGTVTFRRGRLIPAPDYTSKQTGGRTNPETHWGTRNPPGPEKHGPVPGSPDPSSLPQKTTTDPTAPMTVESGADPGTGQHPWPWKGTGVPRSARPTYTALCLPDGETCKHRGGHPGPSSCQAGRKQPRHAKGTPQT